MSLLRVLLFTFGVGIVSSDIVPSIFMGDACNDLNPCPLNLPRLDFEDEDLTSSKIDAICSVLQNYTTCMNNSVTRVQEMLECINTAIETYVTGTPVGYTFEEMMTNDGALIQAACSQTAKSAIIDNLQCWNKNASQEEFLRCGEVLEQNWPERGSPMSMIRDAVCGFSQTFPQCVQRSFTTVCNPVAGNTAGNFFRIMFNTVRRLLMCDSRSQTDWTELKGHALYSLFRRRKI